MVHSTTSEDGVVELGTATYKIIKESQPVTAVRTSREKRTAN